MVQLQDVGDGAEPGEEGGHLLELAVPELHERRGGEHAQRGHLERAVLEAVEVGHDEHTGDLELSRRLAVPALPSYIQWKMEDDHTYRNM